MTYCNYLHDNFSQYRILKKDGKLEYMGEIKGRLSYSANRRNETGGVYSIAEGKILLPEGHDVKAGDVFIIADLRIVIRSVKEVKDFDGKTVLTGAYT